MAASRSVNSLWSGAERVRIGERLKATLAGVLELELLRCKQLEVVDAALERRDTPAAEEPGQSAATSRRQQAVCSSETMVSTCQSSPDDNCRGGDPRWSTLSWDAQSDLLSPPTPDPGGTHLDSDSRPSSGFYSVSGSSLSDSSYSVSSEAALGGSAAQTKGPKDHVAMLADNSDIVWSDGAVQEQQTTLDVDHETTVSVSADNEVTGLSFLSEICSDFSQALISSLVPILDPNAPTPVPSKEKRPLLDPRYCNDLVSRRTKEVYSYPSPLHAVALQSPLFTPQSQEQSHSPEEASTEDGRDSRLDPGLEPKQSKVVPSSAQLETYIHRLARQHKKRAHSSSSDLTLASAITQRGLSTPGKSHGSTQSLSTVPGGSITPCKSLMGNSARVSLSAAGKKAIRNSINLGNLPSATGEDVSINLHLNLNLNLAPGPKSGRELADNPNTESGGTLGSDSTSMPSIVPAPALRTRPRISTCPSSLSHRSSLEVSSGHAVGPGFGSTGFCRSLDWSAGGASPEPGLSVFGANCGSAPGSQRSSLIHESGLSPRLSEDCHMVGEISRLSGLSRAVVVGLMEQGVELDVECFQADPQSESKIQRKSHPTAQTESSNYGKHMDLSPQRPIQLSLSVTHSPQSQTSLTPPRSHSNSPIHPYQSIQVQSPYYPSHGQYHQIPSEPPSSTASSPASRPTQRGRSPPRPLQQSPMSATPLTVFRRDAPFQCSLPRTITRTPTLEHGSGIQPRGGSLRQSVGGWSRAEGEGLYKGKHASHKLIRAATVSSYAKSDDYGEGWAADRREQAATPKKSGNKFCRGFDRNVPGKGSGTERQEADRFECGYGWRRDSGSWGKDYRRGRAASGCKDRKPKAENSPTLVKTGREEGERRSSSLRLSRRALFRSESQGLLVPQNYTEEPKKRPHWVSSFDVAHGDMGAGRNERGRLRRAKEEEKRLSSTASLFNLSRSQSLEGSSHSLSSPLSSPSFSPSPPPSLPLQRSRSLRDLGRKVFGSMRSLSLKRKK